LHLSAEEFLPVIASSIPSCHATFHAILSASAGKPLSNGDSDWSSRGFPDHGLRVWCVAVINGRWYLENNDRLYTWFSYNSVWYYVITQSTLKFVSLAILELLPFNDQKFMGSRDPGHAPFAIQGLAAAKQHRLNYEPL